MPSCQRIDDEKGIFLVVDGEAGGQDAINKRHDKKREERDNKREKKRKSGKKAIRGRGLTPQQARPLRGI